MDEVRYETAAETAKWLDFYRELDALVAADMGPDLRVGE